MFVGDGAALGMRRLSIIDLAGGPAADPQRGRHRSGWSSTARSTTTASCAPSSSARGHRFYTDTDTETIVHAYEEWGEDAFSRLRGMFGIAIWDRRSAHAAARPRPRRASSRCTTRERGGRLYFGSEIKSILADRHTSSASLDPAALDHYLSFLYTPARRHRSSWASGSCRPAICCAGRRHAVDQALLGAAAPRNVHRLDGGGRRER